MAAMPIECSCYGGQCEKALKAHDESIAKPLNQKGPLLMRLVRGVSVVLAFFRFAIFS